jgi:hypothetical protein
MKVKRSEAEKNWSAMKEKEKAPPKSQPTVIHVVNLPMMLTRRDVIDVISISV